MTICQYNTLQIGDIVTPAIDNGYLLFKRNSVVHVRDGTKRPRKKKKHQELVVRDKYIGSCGTQYILTSDMSAKKFDICGDRRLFKKLEKSAKNASSIME